MSNQILLKFEDGSFIKWEEDKQLDVIALELWCPDPENPSDFCLTEMGCFALEELLPFAFSLEKLYHHLRGTHGGKIR